MIIKHFVIAFVAIVTILEDSDENLAINPILILAQIHAQDIILTTRLGTNIHITIVIDLGMINKTKTPPHVFSINLALNILQPRLVVHINLTFVLGNAPLAIKTPLLDDINHPIALLVNHLLIDIETDLTRTHEFIQIPITNLLSIALNNQFLIFIIPYQHILNLK